MFKTPVELVEKSPQRRGAVTAIGAGGSRAEWVASNDWRKGSAQTFELHEPNGAEMAENAKRQISCSVRAYTLITCIKRDQAVRMQMRVYVSANDTDTRPGPTPSHLL